MAERLAEVARLKEALAALESAGIHGVFAAKEVLRGQ